MGAGKDVGREILRDGGRGSRGLLRCGFKPRDLLHLDDAWSPLADHDLRSIPLEDEPLQIGEVQHSDEMQTLLEQDHVFRFRRTRQRFRDFADMPAWDALDFASTEVLRDHLRFRGGEIAVNVDLPRVVLAQFLSFLLSVCCESFFCRFTTPTKRPFCTTW